MTGRRCCRRCSRRTLLRRGLVAATLLALTTFSLSFDALLLGDTPARWSYTWTYSGEPVAPRDIETCFEHVAGNVTLTTSSARGDAAAVVSLSSLVSLAEREGLSLQETAAQVLYGALEGGAYHVVLIPGGPASLWRDDAVGAVREAVAEAVDQHGDALPAFFSGVTPSAVRVRACSPGMRQRPRIHPPPPLRASRSAWASATSARGSPGGSQRARSRSSI